MDVLYLALNQQEMMLYTPPAGSSRHAPQGGPPATMGDTSHFPHWQSNKRARSGAHNIQNFEFEIQFMLWIQAAFEMILSVVVEEKNATCWALLAGSHPSQSWLSTPWCASPPGRFRPPVILHQMRIWAPAIRFVAGQSLCSARAVHHRAVAGWHWPRRRRLPNGALVVAVVAAARVVHRMPHRVPFILWCSTLRFAGAADPVSPKDQAERGLPERSHCRRAPGPFAVDPACAQNASV